MLGFSVPILKLLRPLTQESSHYHTKNTPPSGGYPSRNPGAPCPEPGQRPNISNYICFTFYWLTDTGCTGSSPLGTGYVRLRRAGLRSGCRAPAPHPSDRSCCRARPPGCGPQAGLSLSTRNLPSPGIKPRSPALAGRFLTTGPPRKSPDPFQIIPHVCRYEYMPVLTF